jgi:type VI secretion system protein ImpD
MEILNMQNKYTKKQLVLYLQRYIASLDSKLSKQVNIILHHNKLQRLEASWRGLYYLVKQVNNVALQIVKIRVLNISWELLTKDMLRVLEFDQSELFQKIYTSEFGHAGGEPFGLLIGDYYLKRTGNQEIFIRDIEVLRAVSKIAAAAFVPFIIAADATMFGVDSFANLRIIIEMQNILKLDEYRLWREFSAENEARFIGVILPHVLMRLPYENLTMTRNFCFYEVTRNLQDYLWGNAGYYFAALILRIFIISGWFADIQQINSIMAGLQQHNFTTDNSEMAVKFVTDIYITDHQEKMFHNAGFIALSTNKYLNTPVFYSCPSIQCLHFYHQSLTKDNDLLISMLHYTLCVSRFAHYIKVMMRNKTGSFISAIECERYLEQWLLQYTANGDDLTGELKIKYPLRAAKIIIKPAMGKAGSYLACIYLQPHLQIEQIETSLQLITELKL